MRSDTRTVMVKTQMFAVGPVLLLVIISSVHCYRSSLTDGPSAEYRSQLQLLEGSLGMNHYWSVFFSEKLNKNSSLKQPDEEFCTTLADPNSAYIDTFEAIKLIVGKCSHSGMYVEYGVKLLGQSVQCFFYRFARLHMAAINDRLYDSNVELRQEFMTKLLVDYQLIADKFTVVRVPLTKLLELITYFHDIVRLPSTYTTDTIPRNVKDRIEKVSRKLLTRIDDEFEVCAMKTTNWFDDEHNRVISLEGLTNRIAPDDYPQSNVTNENISSPSGAQTIDPVLSKADDLRKVMVRVFRNMLVQEMSSEIWNDVFNAHIFFKEPDVQKIIGNSPELQKKIEESNKEEEEEGAEEEEEEEELYVDIDIE